MNRLPKRKPNRLRAYDYTSGGYYFITFCTKDQRKTLSRITGTPDDGCHTELTEWGKVVEQAILSIPEHYDGACAQRYVIMPNHVHLLLYLPADGGRMISAPTVVGSLKRYVSRVLGAEVWQKGFYDHVIRTDADHLLHLRYIDENPVKWQMGKDNYYA